jgi:S-disulfanyl-L-cysteine oxidoreductase SoxD
MGRYDTLFDPPCGCSKTRPPRIVRGGPGYVDRVFPGLAAGRSSSCHRPLSPGWADLAPWDISIAPDGVGLPPGSGTPAQGAAVYAERGCALCHGEKGGGGPGGALVGGGPLNSPDRDPAKLIGNYWPYATTHRQRSVRTDRLYPCAEQDHRRKRCDERGDGEVKMPNRDGFISKYPEKL